MESWVVAGIVKRAVAEGNSTGLFDDSTPLYENLDPVYLYAGHVDGKRLACAFLTWVVYDFLLTIDDSVNLFWKYQWNISKLMFLVNRYNTLFTLTVVLVVAAIPSPSTTFCNIAPWIQLIGTVIIIVILDLAMIARVYALWNRSKRILMIVLSFLGVHITSYITLLAYSYAKGSFVAQAPPFTGCLIILGYDKAWLFFVTSLVFEVIVVSLTVYKSWSLAVARGIRTPVYTMLLEDGVVYFLIIIAAHILSFVCVMGSSTLTFPVVGSYPSLSVSGVACGRLFTRLQRLLLSRSKGQSGLSTEGIWSSAWPEFNEAAIRTKSEPTSTQLQQQSDAPAARMRKTKSSASKHQLPSVDHDDAIGMETITKMNTPSRQAPIEENSGNNDTGGYIQETARSKSPGLGIQSVTRAANGVGIEVRMESSDPELINRRDRKNVLDPSPHSPNKISDVSGNGSLFVSRMGRYN